MQSQLIFRGKIRELNLRSASAKSEKKSERSDLGHCATQVALAEVAQSHWEVYPAISCVACAHRIRSIVCAFDAVCL